jgi:hypothetical protein
MGPSVRVAASLLVCLLLLVPSRAVAQAGLVNGGFGAWTAGVPDGWDISGSVTEISGHDGSGAQIASGATIGQDLGPLPNNIEYTISFYAVSLPGNTSNRIGLSFDDLGCGSIFVTSGSFQQYQCVVTTDTTFPSLYILNHNDDTGAVVIDSITISYPGMPTSTSTATDVPVYTITPTPTAAPTATPDPVAARMLELQTYTFALQVFVGFALLIAAGLIFLRVRL